jgi:3-hydroxyisobutyrate dehydrogenase
MSDRPQPVTPIGVVGFGAMGRAFADLMLQRGITPLVYDISAEARELAVALGCAVSDTAAELSERCRVVHVIVRTDDEVVEAMSGSDGMLAGARPGTLAMIQSSVAPSTTTTLQPAATERGVGLIDACPSGVPDVVRAGNATLLVGGPTELVQQFGPNIALLGKHVLHMGPLGSGNVAKLLHNMVSGAQRLLLWDAARLSEAAGISYLKTLEMLRTTERERGSQIERWEHLFETDGSSSTPRIGVNVIQKDIPLAAELARQLRLDLPLVAALEQTAGALLAQHRMPTIPAPSGP